MRISHFLYLTALGTLLGACRQSDPVPVEWKLVWEDSFNGNSLDKDNWNIQTGDGSQYGLYRWGNNEEQYYKAGNLEVKDGKLYIKAVREDVGEYKYTSARINTAEKFDFQYGRVEASIRADRTGGLWHAFWMLPTNPAVNWPVSGEIDIMEYVGNAPLQVLNYIHFANTAGNHESLGDAHPLEGGGNVFHQYAVEWSAEEINWYVDSSLTYSVSREDDIIRNTWPFDESFHIILNTAIGGNLGGSINVQELNTPKYMEVEYVRVFQKR